ncbi:MAG: ATP cone domain-containing protein, partial [Bacillota bacterium]
MSLRVRKRDGATLQDYQDAKVQKAIAAAARDAGVCVADGDTADMLSEIRTLACEFAAGEIVGVEDVQDVVERTLMARYPTVAKAYILYRDQRTQARQARLHPDPEAVANYIHPGKYSRYLPENRRREVYAETVARTESMHLRKYGHIPGMEVVIKEAFQGVYATEVLPSMRSMQFGGEAVERNNCRIYNCSYSLCDRPRFFQEALYLLLCGTGVGFSVQFDHVEKIPALKRIDDTRVRHHVIGDSIEGWGDAVGALFDSYLKGYYVEFAYKRIRDRGMPLKTSGGKAPGHLPFKRALEKVRGLLHKAQGRQLRPIECFRIMCVLADAVLSGGIRRSAMICLFSLDDGEMLNAKTGEWYRDWPEYQNANISVVLKRDEAKKPQFKRVFRMTRQWGEPGFYFTNDYDYGANPCVEIGMNPVLTIDSEVLDLIQQWQREFRPTADALGRSLPASASLGPYLLPKHLPIGSKHTGWQFCNLTEQNAARFRTAEDFFRAARRAAVIGTLQAGYVDMPYLGWISEIIARREALIGVGMTGAMDSPDIALNPEYQRQAAETVKATNAEIARMIGIRPAARCTCVKPSGTTSLELGCVGSGIHPHHARRYFRRVVANELEPVFQYFRSVNPHMCVKKPNGDWVIEFPVEAPAGAIVSDELSAMQFLEKVLSTQVNWVETGTARPESSPGLIHNVSNTVICKEEDWDAVAEFIWTHRDHFNGVALLPATGDKDYAFAPREAVVTPADEAKWNYLLKNYKPVDYLAMVEDEDATDHKAEAACAGGMCELV